MIDVARYELEGLLAHFGDFAWALLGLIGAALVMTGFAIVAAPRATTPTRRVLTILPAALLTVGATATLVTVIDAARDAHVHWVVDLTPAVCSLCAGPPPIVDAYHALWLLPPLLLLAAPGVLVALARTGPQPLLMASAAIAFGAGAIGALAIAQLRAAVSVFRHHGPALRDALAELSSAIDLAPYAIVAVTGVALLAVLAHRARTAVPITRTNAAPIAAFAIFALGASAFAATRGHAADRRHPAPLTSARWSHMHSPPIVPQAPGKLAEDRCREPEIAPTLEVRAEGLRLDGRRYETPETLALDLETMRRNWDVLHGPSSFDGVVHLYVAPDAPPAALHAVLELCATAGYDRPRDVHTRPRLVPTHTLGDVEVTEVCVLDPSDEK